MLKRLWARLTGGRVVWLLDHDVEQTRSIARPQGFGRLAATRMQFNPKAVLLEDGTVASPSYVKRWEYESTPAQQTQGERDA